MLRLPPALVVGCTNRKRFAAAADLVASRLPNGPQDVVLANWRDRVRYAAASARVSDLYCGRGFQEALAAASRLGGPLWVVSAGLGLVNSYSHVPSYDLTLSPNSEQSIRRRINSGPFSEGEWWAGINAGRRGVRPLKSLIEGDATRDRYYVLALSTQYLTLVSADLQRLRDRHRRNIRILTRNGLPAELECLAPYCLEYGDRLDGPDSPVPGTGADFASRMARHFAEHIWLHAPYDDIDIHRRLLDSRLQHLRRPTHPSRTRRSDSDIVQLIHKHWDRVDGRSSRMLRLLRDEKNIACEQSRFRHLFHIAATERAS